MEVLRNMFGPDIADATDMLVFIPWWNNQFQRGRYSNYYAIYAYYQLVHDIKLCHRGIVSLCQNYVEQDRLHQSSDHYSETTTRTTNWNRNNVGNSFFKLLISQFNGNKL